VNEKLYNNDQDHIDQLPSLKLSWGFCLFLVAYYFAYRYGMTFSQSSASPFWFPDSVLLCALLWSPPRIWWLFILAALPIRLFVPESANVPSWFLLVTSASDFAKGLLTASLLRHFNKNPIRFGTLKEFVLFFLFAVLLIPAASAFAGAAALHARGVDYWQAWGNWFLGDATTQLVITPAILYWLFGAPWKKQFILSRLWIEAGILILGLIAFGYLAFHTETSPTSFAEPLFFAPVPFLFWSSIRFGMAGASGAIVIIAIIAVQAALDARGPFAGLSPADTAFALQNFLLLRAAPLYLVAILVDQKGSIQRSLRESEERFRNMANAAPVLIWMTDQNKADTFFNQVWLDFTGRTMQQELNNGWKESVHQDDLQHYLEVFYASFDLRLQFEVEYRMRRNDGEYRWLLDKGVPRYAPNGDFVGYIGTSVDITDRKRVEEANRNLAHSQRLTILGEFTAMIAHEINQPLTAIMSNTETVMQLLENKNSSMKEIREILDDIRNDDLRATETISGIRSLLRKREMQMGPVDVNQITSDVLRLVTADAIRRRVQIRRDFEQNLPLAIGDSAYLQHVLLNLISNGIEAMKDNSESGRQLTVETKHDRNNGIEVCVRDCGCGIAPDKLPQIFNSFFTTKDGGMGLGLSISRSIIEAHKGHIWVENNATGGAAFHFTVKAFAGETQHQ
jgi:PAS domain S-box-containing protein